MHDYRAVSEKMTTTSSPTDLFSALSLNPDMNPTGEEVRSRAIEIRDVLSSFDRDVLPAEYRPEIFNKLVRPRDNRPLTGPERTIQLDLVATLLQWGAYDKQACEVVVKLQPLVTRTRCFHEKLGRRFDQIFYDYDVLDGTIASSQEAHDEVRELARRFTEVVSALLDDRRYREDGQSRSAQYAMAALLGVCERNEDIMLADLASPASQRSGSSNTRPPRSDVSFFQVLVRDLPSPQAGGGLLLDLLESYPQVVLRELKDEMDKLVILANGHGAPSAFIRRAERLQTLAHNEVPSYPASPNGEEAPEDDDSSSDSGGPTPAPPVIRVDAPAGRTRAGSKRSAAVESPTKRGRTKTTK